MHPTEVRIMSSHRLARTNTPTVVHRIAAGVLAASLSCAGGLAHAWGDEGHQIIGLIADHYLDSGVRAQVNLLLASDASGLTSGTDIAHEATWADRFRDSDRTTGPHYTRTHLWHYVDIELSGP